MYVVYIIYAVLNGEKIRYVGSGEWPRRLVKHARGHSSLAARGAMPLHAVILAFTDDRERAYRLEAYFQRLLAHNGGRYVRRRPAAARLPGRFKRIKLEGLTVLIPDAEGAAHTAWGQGGERPGREPEFWEQQPRGPPAS